MSENGRRHEPSEVRRRGEASMAEGQRLGSKVEVGQQRPAASVKRDFDCRRRLRSTRCRLDARRSAQRELLGAPFLMLMPSFSICTMLMFISMFFPPFFLVLQQIDRSRYLLYFYLSICTSVLFIFLHLSVYLSVASVPPSLHDARRRAVDIQTYRLAPFWPATAV